jgi:phosphoglycolate phosphatase
MSRSASAILFDLDGTLLNSVEDLASSMNRILDEDGLPTHDVPAYQLFIGGGARKLVWNALPEDRRPETDAYLARFRTIYRDNLVVKTAPYPGIAELLDVLSGRGLPMAILSNKPDEMTQILVQHFFGAHAWRAVAGAREGEAKKPDPSVVAPMLEALAVPAGEVLMVGDTKTDMQTADNAGMRGVGVSWGFRDRAELVEHGASTVIDDPAQLLELI